MKLATQVKGTVMPLVPASKHVKAQAITEDMKKHQAFAVLRQQRSAARLFGRRQKKAKEGKEEGGAAAGGDKE